MTKAEWEEECGFHDKEEYLVAAIKRCLRTDEQRQLLYTADLSIEDLLNGRYSIQYSVMVQHIFDEWNKKLGWKEFGF